MNHISNLEFFKNQVLFCRCLSAAGKGKCGQAGMRTGLEGTNIEESRKDVKFIKRQQPN